MFERLTEKHLPDLYDLLKHKLKILEMISLGWFLTLFLSVLDSEVAVNIIDCFFISGAKVRGGINSLFALWVQAHMKVTLASSIRLLQWYQLLESRFLGAAFNNSGDLCSVRQISCFVP